MYSFAQRSDTRVVDEPLSAHYLKLSGAEHPGRETVLENSDYNAKRVIRDVILGEVDRPVLFLKQMAHHLLNVPRDFIAHTCNLILTRDPHEVLPSLSVQLGIPHLSDTGYKIQTELLDDLSNRGQQVQVLDARELLLNPPAVLAELCQRIGIEFQPGMLEWPAGPREFDGIWAPWWYQNVHRSTGFIPYAEKTMEFPEQLETLLGECLPHYDILYSAAIKAPFRLN